MKPGASLRALTLAALVVATVFAGGLASAQTTDTSTPLDPAGDNQQNPYVAVEVTKDVHDMAAYGTGLEAVRTYESNDGAQAVLDAVVNDTADEPIRFTPTDVNFSDAGLFPVDTDVSALTAAEWTTSSTTVTDVTTAPGVEALEVATGGSNTGTATASFANFSITSDAQKRYLQVAYDVVSVDSGTTLELRAVDGDGDYVALDLENATGEGYVAQAQVGQLTVAGSGDGTISEVQSLEVVAIGGDATVRISALNAERMGMWTFGERLVDTDGDDELETEAIQQVTTAGPIAVTGLDTLGPAFDSAELHDLTFDARFYGSLVGASDFRMDFSDAQSYPSFSNYVDLFYRLQLPSAYDLSYADAALRDRVKLPGNRYTTVEYAEGTGDTAFGDISSWTSVLADYSTIGTNVTVDGTIQPGTSLVYHAQYLVTGQERSALESGGGLVGPMSGSGSSGGILDFLISLPGMAAAAAAGLLGIRLKGWRS